MTYSDTVSAPATLRVDRGIRFWELSIPLTVFQHCAGNALLLAAWVAVAGTLLEDEALRGSPRSIHDLIAAVTQQLGLAGQPTIVLSSLLVALAERQLLVVDNDQIMIPWGALAAASVTEAQRRIAAAEERSTAPTTLHHQDNLPGFATDTR